MKDLQAIVVTGATSGIGFQTALALAQRGSRVIIVGRNAENAEAALIKLRDACPKAQVEAVLGDLSHVKAVLALAQAIRNTCPRIDVLINNAGRMAPDLTHNEDGFESNFAVNVVAPLMLTKALSPAFVKNARVVQVTGGDSGKLDMDNLQCEKGFDGLNSYSHSKRALEAGSLALSRELQAHATSLHIVYPGQAATSMTRSVRPSHFPWWARPFYPLFKLMVRPDGGKSAARAARSSVWAATDASLQGQSGGYFDTHCKATRLDATVLDPINQDRVYALANSVRG